MDLLHKWKPHHLKGFHLLYLQNPNNLEALHPEFNCLDSHRKTHYVKGMKAQQPIPMARGNR